ncbi:amino acid adenylation domain-containing protein, partial [Variovorax boronicumulans]|uniref:amino acid adenylation domain-containing protein n=1 Tax=Variovorax boronicumulans TaxID=436515 RepID=UPI003392A687
MTAIERRELLQLAKQAKLSRKQSSDEPLPTPGTPRPAELPLSYAQQRLWFLEQLSGPSPTYLVSDAWRLRGRLDRAVLESALQALTTRHESLRSTFVEVDGTPQLRLLDAAHRVPLAYEDLSDRHDGPSALRERLAAEAMTPFDLARGPLLRARLLRLGENEHVLALTLHHIVYDGWSANVLAQDLQALYAACLTGRADSLPQLPLQYPDYAAWQRRWLSGERLQEQAAYWQRTLAGAPLVLDLPTDRPRPAQQDFAGDCVAFQIDQDLAQALRRLGQRHGCTLYMTVLAAWAAVLARCSGQREVLIGTPVAGRVRPELESLIGLFVNTLVLRVGVGGNGSDLLLRVRRAAIEAQQHQDLPFEQVVELLKPPRMLGHSPLFQAMYSLVQEAETPAPDESRPLHIEQMSGGVPVARFDISLLIVAAGDRLAGSITYATALFDRATIENHIEHLRAVLQALAEDESQPVRRVPLQGMVERQQIAEWNRTEAALPAVPLIHRQFDLRAAQTPDAVAVVDGQTELSYSALQAQSLALAAQLRRLGAGPGRLVVLLLPRSAALVVAELAVLYSGAAYVPLDPELPAQRLALLAADSGAPVLLHAQGERPAWATQACLEVTASAEVPADVAAAAAAFAAEAGADGHPLAPAYVMYTSGSTGAPKGVMVSHRGVCNFARNDRSVQLRADDVVAFASNPSFDSSTLEVWGTLLAGARIVVVPQATLLEPAALAQCARTQGITALILVAGLLRAYAETLAHAFPRLRWLITGGDVADGAAIATVLRHNPPETLLQTYGPTETTQFVTTLAIDELPAPGSRVPIGRPIANSRIHVLDNHLQPVPRGVIGEICIAGEGLALGYLGRTELTAERFVPDPHGAPGARMYRTGDTGRWLPEGRLEFTGRNDEQAKVRGFRIEPGEIEAALQACPGVHRVVVVARQDGPGEKRLVAYYTTRPDADAPQPADLRALLVQRLPDYMVPAAFVQLAALPLTATGKIDRLGLPVPDLAALARAPRERPREGVEQALAALWSEVLGEPDVGRDDDFFELGGHSLAAVQLVSRVNARLGLEATVAQLFRYPTLAAFAAALGNAAAEPTAIEPAERNAPLPLGFAQQRLWFLARLDQQANAAYALVEALRLHGALDVVALQAALDRIVARHEILRTRITLLDGVPAQCVDSPAAFALRHEALAEGGDTAQAVRERASAFAAEPFDMATGPLARGLLLRCADHEHVLLVAMHHVVSDGWSMALLVHELNMLYAAFARGAEDPLPPLRLQYADFTAWQRHHLAGERLERQLSYWKAHLAGAPALLTLPTDRPRPPVQSFAGSSIGFELDAELTAALHELSRRHGATLFMTLLAAWAALLSRLSAQQSVVIGTPLAGRTRPEFEALVGCFVNTLALHIDLSASPSVEELLQRVRTLTLEAQDHQDLPFEQIIDAVQPVRSLAYNPLLQVWFVWQNAPSTELELPGLQWQMVPLDATSVQFELALDMRAVGDRIGGTLSYATALFDRATIERHVRRFITLLQGMVAGDGATVARLPLLAAGESASLLALGGGTPARRTEANSVHALFAAQVLRTPQAAALTGDGECLSYAELDARANRLAHHLRASGVGAGARVALCLERGVPMVISLLGVLKAGAAYVPLDPAYPAERLAYMIQDSAACMILSDPATATLAARIAPELPCLDLIADSWRWAGAPEDEPHHEGLAAAPAYVIYTSGSTGRPKGVLVSHDNLMAYTGAALLAYGLIAGDRVLQCNSIGFDVAADEIFPTLLGGATLVLMPWQRLPAVSELCDFADRERLSVLNLPTGYWHEWAQTLELRRAPPPPSLRLLIIGGDAASPARLAQWHRLARPGVRLVNSYGPTETTVGITFGTLSDDQVHVGAPGAGSRLYLLDEHGQLVPPGCVGELFIGGPQVAHGYLNAPELTAERFMPDPHAAAAGTPGARMYRSGDLARWRSDGMLDFIGRNDTQLKLRGYRIELGEIEAALARVPGVREAAVLARDHLAGPRLVAYLAVPDDARPTPAALREQLAATLPEHMLPAAYVMLPALPRGAHGKLDLRALPEPADDQAGTPDGEASDADAPQGAIEAALAAMWTELLGAPRVGRHDNFFELGGHSLLAITLIERMRQLDWELPVRALFTAPTLAALAEQVRRAGGVVVP